MKRGKPYIKKIGKISDFIVWQVDGAYVRRSIDAEFTNLGQHYRFNFIPKKEFWIDKEFGKDNEEKFFIDHLLIEYKLMDQGKSYQFAITKADTIEKAERSKSLFYREERRKAKNKEALIKEIHKRELKEYSKEKLKVWIVDGNLVRDAFFIDFTEGGHDRVYNFIPKNEVWIDNDVSQKERKFVLLHELHERYLMGLGWEYSTKTKSAHYAASKVEYYCRHHPKELDKMLKEVVRKNS